MDKKTLDDLAQKLNAAVEEERKATQDLENLKSPKTMALYFSIAIVLGGTLGAVLSSI